MTVRLSPRGVLLVFEGIDGAGKTTQARALASSLRSFDLEVVETKEPTSGRWGTKLRDSASSGRLSPSEELQLFIKDRREHVENVIAPALARGAVVIVDRYFLSTAAYQGARGMDPETILRANEEFAPLPDVLFLLEVTPEVGRARIAERGDRANLFEDASGLAEAARIFSQMSREYIRRLDGTRSITELKDTILIVTYEDLIVPRMSAVAPASLDPQAVLRLTREVERDDEIPLDEKPEILSQRIRRELM